MGRFKHTISAGQRFSRLVVLDVFYHTGFRGRRNLYCHVVCDCGTIFAVIKGDLFKGTTQSCGCLRREVTSQRYTKHGASQTRLWQTWQSMRQRCKNPHHIAYPDYGGRGITVCEEWDTSCSTFRDWALAHGYTDELTLDRIDVNGNYTPDNCRFATYTEQANNKRNSALITCFGEAKTASQWAADPRCIVGRNTLADRMYRGWTPLDALTRPLRHQPEKP